MLHDETLHYLDNAATTRVDPAVADAIRAAMTDLWANPSALYTPGLQAQQALGKARAQVAKTLGCTPGEVYFTACGSESNNLALRGAAIARKGWGRKILCSGYEHPSAALPVEQLGKEGFEVDFVPPGPDGRIDVAAMADRVDKGTCLVTCMQVNNETGAVADVETLARLTKERNPRTAVHVDGVQAWLRVPAALAGVDSFTVSGHKVHAPKGIGALYLRKGYHIEPPYLGGGQEKGIRPGTENVPYAVGLGEAARLMAANSRERKARVAALNARLRQGVAALPEVTVNSPDDAVPEILNISLNVIRSETMLHFLEQRRVYVSSGSACSKGAASHTLAAMGLSARAIDTALRISLCGDNTEQDIDELLTGLSDGLAKLARLR